MKAFAKRGYRETGTADIAGEIGISEPTLYRYFENKRQLYLECVEQASREILDHWRGIAAQSPTPVDALLALGMWYFEDLQRDTSHLMLRARAEVETDDPEVKAKLRSLLLETFDFIHGLYEDAQKKGLVGKDVDLASRTWLFIGLGSLIDRTELLTVRDRLDLDELAKVIASLAPELVPSGAPVAD